MSVSRRFLLGAMVASVAAARVPAMAQQPSQKPNIVVIFMDNLGLSQQGYSTGMWDKWHLGSAEARLPSNRGFDEWYGIPRTYDEAEWPSLNQTGGMWPSVGNKQGWNARIVPPEPIYDARKGEASRQI